MNWGNKSRDWCWKQLIISCNALRERPPVLQSEAARWVKKIAIVHNPFDWHTLHQHTERKLWLGTQYTNTQRESFDWHTLHQHTKRKLWLGTHYTNTQRESRAVCPWLPQGAHVNVYEAVCPFCGLPIHCGTVCPFCVLSMHFEAVCPSCGLQMHYEAVCPFCGLSVSVRQSVLSVDCQCSVRQSVLSVGCQCLWGSLSFLWTVNAVCPFCGLSMQCEAVCPFCGLSMHWHFLVNTHWRILRRLILANSNYL